MELLRLLSEPEFAGSSSTRVSPSRSQEKLSEIVANRINFHFYASDISLLSYPAKVFLRWSERKALIPTRENDVMLHED